MLYALTLTVGHPNIWTPINSRLLKVTFAGTVVSSTAWNPAAFTCCCQGVFPEKKHALVAMHCECYQHGFCLPQTSGIGTWLTPKQWIAGQQCAPLQAQPTVHSPWCFVLNRFECWPETEICLAISKKESRGNAFAEQNANSAGIWWHTFAWGSKGM